MATWKTKALIVAGIRHYDVSGSRPIIGRLVNEAHAGKVVVISSTKGRAAALVPMHMLDVLNRMGIVHTIPEEPTMGVSGPRKGSIEDMLLPAEVTAHSPPADRSTALAEAFEQPPIEPSNDGIGVDDEFEPDDEMLAEMEHDQNGG